MKICLSCGGRFGAPDWRCPACGFEPELEDDTLLFAPEHADRSESFDARWFPELAAQEAESFWFRNRNRVIIWALRRYFPGTNSFLEVGCGTGFVLAGIREAMADIRLAGGELLIGGLPFARERVPGASLYQLDARRLPFDQEFDVVGAFDVLEHIDEDEEVLAAMRRAAKSRGGVMMTVPQHRWLWSAEDEVSGHKRRYSRRELVGRLERAGLRLERVTSFVSLLLPLMAASRLPLRAAGDGRSSRGHLIPPFNRTLEKVLTAELALVRAGMSLPAGGSLLAVARRV